MEKRIYIAPVQGHTDAAWRHYHHASYGGENPYFTPFIRCERSELRKQDLRDYTSELNGGIDLEPQVIFRDMAELEILLDSLSKHGAERVNLNMGCPFPLQTGKGRGAGFLAKKEEIERLPDTLAKFPGISYSVKMRLGYENPEEWRNVLPTLNCLDLRHIDVHPRVAKQQYGGELNLEQFGRLLAESRNPVVFNGDIKTPEDIGGVIERFPEIVGIMTARGVLGRPSLAREAEECRTWSREERIEKMLSFHRSLLHHYSETLCGEAQILSKIRPFWEYAEEEIGRKAWKAIKKAGNIAKYHSAVAMIE
ncbi:MAG: tRNA-dihydrouridine synthase family protein [Muribaculaceae bacterium]|nr:tRNA-dihydrouridine synthase family protein [Muribaculaceae bacterium]